jgi:DNA topoisomerase-3
MELVIAEKPSVARDIARVLGAERRGDGCLRGPHHTVTWCIGHLVELEEPGAYSEAWKRWSLDALPMLPDTFRLRPSKGSIAQWRVVRDLLRSREFTSVINACDAGREGELIFRYCYELAGARLPVRRLWISSMTDAALRAGFASLRDGRHYEPLADAARCRAEADWLVGMNATRAVTTRTRNHSGGALFSIGRVQTPTLALVVERERAITRFVPRDYWEILGKFTTLEGDFQATYGYLNQRRLASLALASELLARLASHTGPTGPRIESLEKKTERQPPPQLFDLTSLQRTANKRFGLSAQRTLDIAQSLYETHKLITYPRTDSRHLSTDLRGELPSIFRALTSSPYAPFASKLLTSPPGPTPRVFNNARVTDHHAIIPTSKAPTALDRDHQHIHDLIVRRFLGAFFPDAEFALTSLTVLVGPDAPPPPLPDPPPARDAFLETLPPAPDRLFARGKVLLSPGWREVAGLDESDDDRGKNDDDEASQRLPPLTRGQRLAGTFAHTQKRTRPPPRYTEATLLSAMEFAGREIEDDALRQALKERGLGTPATRASTIETLLRRGYLERQQKNLIPTALGTSLIDLLPVRSLASPELTGEWEARLVRMARGEEPRQLFMNDIARYVREIVEQVRTSPPPTPLSLAGRGGGGPQRTSPPLAPLSLAGRGGSGNGRSHRGTVQRSSGDQARVGVVHGVGRFVDEAKLARARGFRKQPTPAEEQAWELLRDRRCLGLKFRRQQVIEGFIVDFFCAEHRLALELDGTAHDQRKEYDETRDRILAQASIRVLRLPNEHLSPTTLRTLLAPFLPPLPARERGVGGGEVPPLPARERGVGGGEVLHCPHCMDGRIIPGKRAWGCSRWKEGCRLVIPYEFAEKKLTEKQLHELITKGQTGRRATWKQDGQERKGKLLLDLQSDPPALRIE